MRIPRIFLDQELAENKSYLLDKESSHHLKVIKINDGEMIELFNSKGQSVIGKIITKEKNSYKINAKSPLKLQKKELPKVSLGIAEIKNFKKILNETTQLGIYQIDCLVTQRSKFKKKPSEKKIQSWYKILQSSCEQSGNNWMPKLSFNKLDKWQEEVKSKNKYYLHPGENLNLRSLTGLDEIFIGIGPEGGFSPEEISSFKSKGFQGVSIRDLIIKTETVPTVLLSMLKVI